MNIQGRNLWQHSAGDQEHNHVDICLKRGVILTGLGDERYFSEDMNAGDIVVLKLGQRVYGVGEIVGEYQWCDEFNDVDGWELGHTRRVCWLWWDAEGHFFYKGALARATTRRLVNSYVISWLETLETPDYQASHSLPDLPGKSTKVSSNEIAAYLFDKGIASDSIRSLLDQNGEFIRIADWYNRSTSPSEHETVCHLVVPLLRILGWTPQRMALEWGKIDIALFSRMPRKDEHLSVAIECKKVGNACLSWAVSQAKNYASKYPNCRRLVVTDGLRYGIFTMGKNKEFSLYAYLNLTRLRNEYPIYECKGAQEAILAMTPEW